MLNIEIKKMDYISNSIENRVAHYIIIADYKNKRYLVSIPNLYLYDKTRSSLQTSRRYATVIAMFYRFLSSLSRYKGINPGDYHSHITNTDIRKWQIYRQALRVKNYSAHPNSDTIFSDACIVLYLFKWLFEKDIPTLVKIHLKTWIPNFKDNRLLNYIARKTKYSLDTNPIRVLDRQSSQKKPVNLISSRDVKTLLESYPDSVYKVLLKFALATAMRPMELVQFPYIGLGENRHIFPYSQMDKEPKTFSYRIFGKGSKWRDIIIPAYALELLNSEYIETEYPARAELYKQKFGRKCPLSILFLTSEGMPVTASSIANATNYAKRLASEKESAFNKTNIFYHTRKWWPTMMMIQHHNGEKILEKNAEVLDAALAEVIKNQLGHESLVTTYNHYLVLGRYLVMANKGITHETIHEKTINVLDAMEEYS